MGYNISKVAERFGIETHTLRYYEKEGIVSPERTSGGIRMYNDDDIVRLEMVMCLKSTGMPIKDIKKYFELVGEGEGTVDERLKIFKGHREHVLNDIEVLQKYLAKIESKIKLYSESKEKCCNKQ